MNDERLRYDLASRGVLLFGIGMVTGLWSAIALTGKVKVDIPRLALSAHLNGLLGGLWLIAVAFTIPLLSYGEQGKRRLALAVLVPAYGNWFVTVIASMLGVRGLELTGNHANDAIAAMLQGIVVLPTLAACFAWSWGFRRPA